MTYPGMILGYEQTGDPGFLELGINRCRAVYEASYSPEKVANRLELLRVRYFLELERAGEV